MMRTLLVGGMLVCTALALLPQATASDCTDTLTVGGTHVIQSCQQDNPDGSTTTSVCVTKACVPTENGGCHSDYGCHYCELGLVWIDWGDGSNPKVGVC